MAEISKLPGVRGEVGSQARGGRRRARPSRCAWCLQWISGFSGATTVSHGLCRECLVELSEPDCRAQCLATARNPS